MKKTTRRLAAVALSMAALSATSVLSPTTASAAPRTNPYLVFIRDGVDPTAKAAQYGITPTHVYTDTMDGFSAPLTSQQVGRMTKDSTVISIEPDNTWPIYEAKPTPLPAPYQPPWLCCTQAQRRVGLLQSPTAKVDGVDERIDIDVAVLDTGIQPDHPDLNVVGGVDCGTSGSKRRWDDDTGHGTMVGGLIGAKDDNYGTVGIAPGARLWSVKVNKANPHGIEGYFISNSDYLCGLEWVAKHADIIEVANLSLGGPNNQPLGTCNDERYHRAICDIAAKGVTVVVSSGNEFEDTANKTPARYPEVITVSGIGDNDGQPGGLNSALITCGNGFIVPEDNQQDDHFAFFANYGQAVDIAAPAVCLGGAFMGSQYAVWAGTSFSSPLVAGAAALYISTHPDATPAQVRQALIDRAEPGPIPGDPDAYPEGVLNVRGL